MNPLRSQSSPFIFPSNLLLPSLFSLNRRHHLAQRRQVVIWHGRPHVKDTRGRIGLWSEMHIQQMKQSSGSALKVSVGWEI